jgi:hypothetical protein
MADWYGTASRYPKVGHQQHGPHPDAKKTDPTGKRQPPFSSQLIGAHTNDFFSTIHLRPSLRFPKHRAFPHLNPTRDVLHLSIQQNDVVTEISADAQKRFAERNSVDPRMG